MTRGAPEDRGWGPGGGVAIECDRCGKRGEFGVEGMEGQPPGEWIELTGLKVSCECGGTMASPEGRIYQSTAGPGGSLQLAFRDLSGPELVELRNILSEASEKEDVTAEEVAVAVESKSPMLATILRTLNDNQGLLGFLSLLTGIISILIALQSDGNPVPPPQINQVIIDMENEHYRDLPIGRNDKCFCGSDTKFKKCHGRHPSADPPTEGKLREE